MAVQLHERLGLQSRECALHRHPHREVQYMSWANIVDSLQPESFAGVLDQIASGWEVAREARSEFMTWARATRDDVLAAGEGATAQTLQNLREQLRVLHKEIVFQYVANGWVGQAHVARRAWLGHLIDLLEPANDGSKKSRRVFVRRAA
jgi:hypothetical protein